MFFTKLLGVGGWEIRIDTVWVFCGVWWGCLFFVFGHTV